MGRRKSELPEVSKRMIRGAWSVYWWWGGKMFSVAVGVSGEEMKDTAEAVRRAISSAVAAGAPFPPPFEESPAAVRYKEARYGSEPSPEAKRMSDPATWLKDYEGEIMAECASNWASESLSRLRKLEAAAGAFSAITPEYASKYLSDIAAKQKAATRNRALITFSRFFKWAVRTERATANPFAGISQLPEPRSSNIVHCTPEEREEIIALARETGWPDWLAVPVAFYTGMRREEVARFSWPDVRFAERLIVVDKTKTGKSRVLPLSAKLEALLSAIPASARRGYVVMIPDGFDRVARLENLTRKIEKVKRAALLAEWGLEKPLPSRSKEYREALARWKEAMKERAAELDAALERIGWNPFRHTFGSLLAQAGVSIDKISAWMGNTPEVCRRHYAQFIPRDRRDSEIDKL